MAVFSRNISINTEQLEDGNMLLTSRMTDVFHDISIRLTVSRGDFTILEAETDLVKIPSEGCSGIKPLVKQLVGLSVVRGFNRNMVSILGGRSGCPNALVLVQASAPLAISTHGMLRAQEGPKADVEVDAEQKEAANFMKGVCVAHS